MRWKRLVLAAALLTCASCAADRSQRRPYLITENLDYAAKHLAAGEKEEAAQLYQVVTLADPFNETARAGLAGIGEYDRCILEPTLLGKNYVCRPLADSQTLWLVLYPINRILDIFDIVSFHVGLEGGAYADAHVTHALQAAAGAGGGMQLGWWQKRELAVGSGHVTGLALGPFSVEGEGATRVGTGGAGSDSFSVVGMSRPTDLAYQRYRDYWGIGVRAVAGVVGAEIEFHPVELADAISGFFFVDILRDDIGRTKSLNLARHERDAMEDLLSTISPEDLRARINGRAIPPPAALPAEGAPAKPPEAPPAAPAPKVQ